MTVLALDLATSTGYALSNGVSGVVSWREYVYDYGHLDAAFRDWLSDLIVSNGVVEVVVEPPILRGAGSILLVGLYWSAQSIAFRHGCRRRDGDSNRVRTWLFGRDRLKELKRAPTKSAARRQIKAAVIAAMQARGLNPSNDDEADAQAMLAWAKEAA